MKLLIAGSRSIKEVDLSPYVPEETSMIISGGAGGVDTIAEQFADSRKLSKIIIRPQYNLYGRAAPLKRNNEMVDMADCVLVIWDGISKGSKHTIDYATKKNKKVIVVKKQDI